MKTICYLHKLRLDTISCVIIGLCLVEVLSGKAVFADIPHHETVFKMKMAGEKPTIPVIVLFKCFSFN